MRAVISSEFLIAPALCDPESIDKYVEELARISSDIINCSRPPVLEDEAFETLVDAKNYPCDKLFNSNIAKADGSLYSGSDIARIVNTILQRAASYGDSENLIAEFSSIEVSPGVFSSQRHSANELLARIAIRSHFSMGDFCFLHFLSESHLEYLTLKIEVLEIAPDPGLKSLPVSIQENVSFFHGYKKFLSKLDGSLLYSKAQNEYDIKLSFYIGALSCLLERGESLDKIDWDDFELGDEFIESLKTHECFSGQNHSSVFFDVTRSVIARFPKNKTKPFMTYAGSTKQRTRGNLSAWRTHITKSNSALRLMYWEAPTGRKILANVANKKDIVIL